MRILVPPSPEDRRREKEELEKQKKIDAEKEQAVQLRLQHNRILKEKKDRVQAGALSFFASSIFSSGSKVRSVSNGASHTFK